ncbi:MAG: IS630 family transposase [Elusimicrobia bacterium CG11_big_fil_rev_8_21_14_0_20_64_6]|nr:MAG: IS630 family transposase [Elusimicrobia bacterium CG11_big_fil_rev_8_21_14_0_20_64_6]
MKIDGRTLSHETAEQIRRMAVQRVKEGEKPSVVIKSYGLSRPCIYPWLRAERKYGMQALAARKHPGRKPALTPRQKFRVRHWVCGKDPRQFGFDFGLWTRNIVSALIKEKFDVTLGLTAVGRLLHQLDITPQKPLRRAYERDPIAIEKWTREEYPKLRARAKRRGAEIFFLDEAGVRSDQVLGRTWGEKGKTPEVPTSGQRQSINAISAVNARGAFWYEVYSGRFNATRFKDEFLKSFMRRRRRPVFLVVDGHPSHRAKMIGAYVKELKGRLELHFLPGYAPELNPDEFVWNYVKHEGVSKKPLKRNESLRQRVASDLADIKRRPALVRSFFGAPSVIYTKD